MNSFARFLGQEIYFLVTQYFRNFWGLQSLSFPIAWAMAFLMTDVGFGFEIISSLASSICSIYLYGISVMDDVGVIREKNLLLLLRNFQSRSKMQ